MAALVCCGVPVLASVVRRGEGVSIWVVPSSCIIASDPADKGMMFEPALSKPYRHPTFYDVPDEVGHM